MNKDISLNFSSVHWIKTAEKTPENSAENQIKFSNRHFVNYNLRRVEVSNAVLRQGTMGPGPRPPVLIRFKNHMTSDM